MRYGRKWIKTCSVVMFIVFTILSTSFLFINCSKDNSTEPDNGNGSEPSIVYAGQDGITIIEPDGTNKRVIVQGDSLHSPVWSPDRVNIAFVRYREFSLGDVLNVVEAEGGDVSIPATDINSIHLGGSPWAPDGSMLVFDGSADYIHIIFTVSLSGGQPTQILTNATDASFISNSDIICAYFPSGHIDTTVIARLNASGGGLTVLASGGEGSYFRPRVSLQRDKIAYIHTLTYDDGNEIWVMNTDGSAQERIATGGVDFPNGRVRGMDFSYDGSKLLLVPDTDDETMLCVLDISSETVEIVPGTSCPEAERAADWSPTTDRFVYEIRGGGIAIVNHDGSNRFVLDGDASNWYSNPNW